MAENISSEPSSDAVATTQDSVNFDLRHRLCVLQGNYNAFSLAATIHDRPLGGVVDEVYAIRERRSTLCC